MDGDAGIGEVVLELRLAIEPLDEVRVVAVNEQERLAARGSRHLRIGRGDEACLAAEPRHAQRWSHPAVYHAGRETGWFLLASTPERKAFPLFESNYQAICERLANGEVLELPTPATATTRAPAPPSPEEQHEHLEQLRRQTGIG